MATQVLPPNPKLFLPGLKRGPSLSSRSAAMLVHDGAGVTFALSPEGATSIGRPDPKSQDRPDIDLSPLDPLHLVSRQHAVIHAKGGTYYLVLVRRATNGTYINENPVSPGTLTPLKDGAILRFAGVSLRFSLVRR